MLFCLWPFRPASPPLYRMLYTKSGIVWRNNNLTLQTFSCHLLFKNMTQTETNKVCVWSVYCTIFHRRALCKPKWQIFTPITSMGNFVFFYCNVCCIHQHLCKGYYDRSHCFGYRSFTYQCLYLYFALIGEDQWNTDCSRIDKNEKWPGIDPEWRSSLIPKIYILLMLLLLLLLLMMMLLFLLLFTFCYNVMLWCSYAFRVWKEAISFTKDVRESLSRNGISMITTELNILK